MVHGRGDARSGPRGSRHALRASLANRCVFATRECRAAAAVTGTPIRIGSNENPYGLGPAALAAVQAGCPEANRYPGASIADLMARLAEVHGVSRDSILITPGSGEILRAATRAFTSPSKTLVAGLADVRSIRGARRA